MVLEKAPQLVDVFYLNIQNGRFERQPEQQSVSLTQAQEFINSVPVPQEWRLVLYQTRPATQGSNPLLS